VALVPAGVVTVTSTAPVLPAGEVAAICVRLDTVKNEAVLEPKWTAVAPVKFVPVTVTDVPPAVDPPVGDTPLTVGGDRGVAELPLMAAWRSATGAAMRPPVAKAKIAQISLPTS
jgi:hypothetical protein